VDVVHQLAARFGAYQFVERPAVVLAVALQLAAQELLLVLVFAALLVVVEPRSGIRRSMASGISPAKMALRAYCVAVGRMAQ